MKGSGSGRRKEEEEEGELVRGQQQERGLANMIINAI